MCSTPAHVDTLCILRLLPQSATLTFLRRHKTGSFRVAARHHFHLLHFSLLIPSSPHHHHRSPLHEHCFLQLPTHRKTLQHQTSAKMVLTGVASSDFDGRGSLSTFFCTHPEMRSDGERHRIRAKTTDGILFSWSYTSRRFSHARVFRASVLVGGRVVVAEISTCHGPCCFCRCIAPFELTTTCCTATFECARHFLKSDTARNAWNASRRHRLGQTAYLIFYASASYLRRFFGKVIPLALQFRISANTP